MLNLITGLVGGWKLYVAIGAVAFGLGFSGAWKVQDWRADAALAKQEAALLDQATKALKTQRDQDAVTAAVGQKAAIAAVKAQTITKTIVKKVPVYVTAKSDSQCLIPGGFVRLHDAAANGTDLPDPTGPTGQPDDTASGIALSTVAGTVVQNYGTYSELAAQHRALQDWIRAQRALVKP